MQVPLPKVFEQFHPEEQPLFPHEVRMRTAASIRLSLLRIRLEEIVQHTRPYTQKALRLQSRRDTAYLTSSPKMLGGRLLSAMKIPLNMCN